MHGVTRPFPLQRDIALPERPDAEPIADFLLNDGDVLYLPRGHWHDVSAIGAESLHLTIGFNRATGVDLVAWLADQLRSEELFRDDLPRFADADSRAARSAALRDRIVALLGDDVVDRFLDDRDAQAPAHSFAGLPWSATSDLLAAGDDAEVRFVVPRAVVTSENGTIAIAAAGKRLVFAAAAEPVITALVDGGRQSVRQLTAGAPDLGRATIRALLGELIVHGMVAPA
jgi:hypothetical protein